MSEVDPRLDALSRLVQLEQDIRHAESLLNLSYVIVNDTRRLLPAQQIIFWRLNDFGQPKVERASNVSEHEANAPMVVWSEMLANWCLAQEWRGQAKVLAAADVPTELAGEWGNYSPPNLLYVPVASMQRGNQGGLFLFAESPWVEGHLALAVIVADAFGHAWGVLSPSEGRRKIVQHLRQHWRRYALGFAIFFLIPIRQYVMVPAEVVARDPAVMAAPLAGVVKRIVVPPNAPVKAGDVLFELDNTDTESRLAVAQRAYDVAQAEYLREAQASFDCDSCRARVAELQAAMQRAQAEADWAKAQLEMTRVRAPEDGVAVYGDANDWEGRPVNVGERVMSVARGDDLRLRILVPVADAIAIDKGTDVVFYPNVSPLNSYDGTVTQTSYEASVQPDQSMAYVLLADLGESGARLGWRGTAKVYGSRAPVFYLVFRRPLSWLRRTLGI